MIKPQKDSPRAHLKDLQDKGISRDKITPLAFYNLHIRKEGEPILSEDEYRKKMREQYNKRKAEPGETGFIIIEEIDKVSLMDKMIPLQREYEDTVGKIQNLIGISKDRDGTTGS